MVADVDDADRHRGVACRLSGAAVEVREIDEREHDPDPVPAHEPRGAARGVEAEHLVDHVADDAEQDAVDERSSEAPPESRWISHWEYRVRNGRREHAARQGDGRADP